jgi:hypothetical protein
MGNSFICNSETVRSVQYLSFWLQCWFLLGCYVGNYEQLDFILPYFNNEQIMSYVIWTAADPIGLAV